MAFIVPLHVYMFINVNQHPLWIHNSIFFSPCHSVSWRWPFNWVASLNLNSLSLLSCIFCLPPPLVLVCCPQKIFYLPHVVPSCEGTPSSFRLWPILLSRLHFTPVSYAGFLFFLIRVHQSNFVAASAVASPDSTPWMCRPRKIMIADLLDRHILALY